MYWDYKDKSNTILTLGKSDYDQEYRKAQKMDISGDRCYIIVINIDYFITPQYSY